MFTKLLLILAYFVSSAFTAPALLSSTILQHQPLLLQSPQLLRIAPDLAIIDRPLPYSFYQTNPYGNVYLLRQGIGDGGQFADQVQDYFGMFGGQFQEFQNQTSGVFQDVQSNIQSSFGQGFELVSQGFEQGFDQVSQGWGDLQQGWGGGSIVKSNNMMSSSSENDELRSGSEKNENKKMQTQPNLLYRPIALKYSTNRFIPLNLVRYNLIPLNLQQSALKPQEKSQLQKPQQQLQSRSSDEKSEKEEPVKAGESAQ